MIIPYPIIALAAISLFLQACNAGPDTPRPIAHTPQASSSPKPIGPSISEQDKQYANSLQALSQRNPELEAQQAIASGDRRLMGYYAGRAGLKLPGLTTDEQEAQRCAMKTLEGLGDVIYGNNHLKYRVALRQFAMRYNIAMKPACL